MGKQNQNLTKLYLFLKLTFQGVIFSDDFVLVLFCCFIFVTNTVICNSVICNSTCKLVSNFVSDFQSVKPAYKLIVVNPERLHERLVNNKNSRQHDFANPFLLCLEFLEDLKLCYLATFLIVTFLLKFQFKG